MDRWALLLWGKVCVLKGKKANIHFIRKAENWMPGITKSMITIFPHSYRSRLVASKTFLVASAGCRRPPSLPDCHFLSPSAFVSFIPSFSQPVCVCPSLSGSSSLLRLSDISVYRWFQSCIRSSYCYYMFKKKEKKAARCHFLSSIVQRRVPRLICVFVFGPFHLRLESSSQQSGEA